MTGKSFPTVALPYSNVITDGLLQLFQGSKYMTLRVAVLPTDLARQIVQQVQNLVWFGGNMCGWGGANMCEWGRANIFEWFGG